MNIQESKEGFFLSFESTLERESIYEMLKDKNKLIYQVQVIDSEIRFAELGNKEDVCNTAMNITYSNVDVETQLISNLGHTPFKLNGITFQSVEAFWQGLKFKDEETRLEIAGLHGKAAKKVGKRIEYEEFIDYNREKIRVGSHEHWKLMEIACEEKFHQNLDAQAALLKTGIRPLYHKPRQDSKIIPGPIMSGIWMNIRSNLRRKNNLQSQLLTNLI